MVRTCKRSVTKSIKGSVKLETVLKTTTKTHLLQGLVLPREVEGVAAAAGRVRVRPADEQLPRALTREDADVVPAAGLETMG